ncbi:hypothetical protein AAULR_26816, partial [Lacticaseibacillus rhamnosus MTCC 5462]
DVSGVLKKTISTIESHTKRLDAITLNDIEKALGITVDALLNEDEREKIRNVSKTSEASFVDKLIEPHKAQRDFLRS